MGRRQPKDSCEQAPAYYTSIRQSAKRRETVVELPCDALEPDRGSTLSKAAWRQTHSLARSTDPAQGLAGEVQRTAMGHRARGRGPQAPSPGGLLPVGSSQQPPQLSLGLNRSIAQQPHGAVQRAWQRRAQRIGQGGASTFTSRHQQPRQ